MGWLKRILDAARPRTYPPLETPSAAYPAPVHMFEHLITELVQNWHADGWAHMEADAPARHPPAVQIAAPDTLNTLDDPVDLPRLLRQIGLDALAESTHPIERTDKTLYQLQGATPAELAQAVHAVFAIHNDLGETYHATGWLEG